MDSSCELDAMPTCLRPLLKKRGLELIEKNFRPVSKLTFISKIIEKSAIGQYVACINTNKLSEPHQSAYKQLNSTETILIKV